MGAGTSETTVSMAGNARGLSPPPARTKMLLDPKELPAHRGGNGRAAAGAAREAAAALLRSISKMPLALRALAPLPGELVYSQTLGCCEDGQGAGQAVEMPT